MVMIGSSDGLLFGRYQASHHPIRCYHLSIEQLATISVEYYSKFRRFHAKDACQNIVYIM